jgi:hypothetical protein
MVQPRHKRRGMRSPLYGHILKGHEEILRERGKAEELKNAAIDRAKKISTTQVRLAELRIRYFSLLDANHQHRGYILEKVV